jgi:hypothetical protein
MILLCLALITASLCSTVPSTSSCSVTADGVACVCSSQQIVLGSGLCWASQCGERHLIIFWASQRGERRLYEGAERTGVPPPQQWRCLESGGLMRRGIATRILHTPALWGIFAQLYDIDHLRRLLGRASRTALVH